MNLLTGRDIGIKVDERWLYREVDFHLAQKRMLAIVGDNGVGKTTLLQAILGQRKLTEGELQWHTENGKQPTIRYVPQYRPDMQAFPLYIKDFVALSFDRGLRPWLSAQEKHQLQHILEDTNLLALAERRIDTASGGERQRAYLAQALAQNPQILILDEATANLDNSAKYELMDVVKHYRDHHDLTIIMVSHDLDIVSDYGDDYLLLTPHGNEFGDCKDADLARLKVRYDADV
jgi:zinc/manganese transport system ATP-binding protein